MPVINDTRKDGFSETFVVNLTNGSVPIDDAQGECSIFDNDPEPKVSIDDRTVSEGAALNAAFRVFLSNASDSSVSVSYATADDTAKVGAPIVTNFDSSGGVTIPPSGAGTPYPSTINVASFSGSVTKATVTLTGLTHSEPSDVSVLLVGPAGQTVVLMSGAGGSFTATNVNLTFDDAASSSVSQSFLSSGTYKPTVVGTAPSFPSPAPAGPYGSALSAFAGQNPVGDWTLYINDKLAPNSGSLTSWRLSLTVLGPADYMQTSGTLTLSPGRTQHTISVPITTDSVAEGTERFFVNLSSPSNASLGTKSQGIGTIEDPPAAQKIAMYRSYNKSTDYHFFTTDLNSKNFAVGTLGFQDESTPIPFYVWNSQQTGTTPLFRMYNPNLGRHFYTASSGSRDFIMGIGGVYEKEEGFVFPLGTSPVPSGATELFLLYNNNSGTHLFTADAGQKDAILGLFPGVWVQHTSVGFVFTSP